MYHHILHATDLNENHFSSCEQAKKIASHFHATLSVLHVIEPPATLQLAQGLGFAEIALPSKDDATLVMRLLGDALNIPKDQQFIEIGSTKEHILTKIKELNCSLLIIGAHMPQQFPDLFDSTTHRLIQDAPCDVLILQKN